MGSGAISGVSIKKSVVTLSTTEAECIAATLCAWEGIWLERILEVFGVNQLDSITVQRDSSSSIKLSKNLVLHGRTKHIDIQFHFLGNLCKDGVIRLEYCPTQDQVEDIMTKALKPDTFSRLRT